VGVFVADAFGRLLATNAAVRKVWGGAVPAGIGADRYAAFRAYRVDTGRLLAPEDWAIARALAGETVLDQELDIVRFDGHCGTILNSAAPIRDESDRLVGAVAINVDISERRRAARDRDFLAEVARALSESLDYDATLRRLVDLAVPRLAEWCAIDVLETEGLRRMAVADAVPERALAGAAAGGEAAGAGPASARVVETGEPLFLPEVTRENLRAALPGGDERIEVMLRAGVRSFLAVPLVARGRTLGAMLFALGSATRRFGRSDLALARELGVRAALAVDNARLYRDAREAIRARDDLWAVASHELRNPLAALLLLVQGSKRALQRGEPGVNERLDKAIHQIRRINALVGDLLDSTRAQSGRLEIRRERVDLAEVALEVVDRHRPEARIAGATLILEDRARPVGCWDPGRLDQVLTNLVGNALKYGGGARIEVVVDRTDGEALLTVADDGPGIAPEDQARIFEPFERVKDSGRKQGLGLGLFIVRRIVEGHGGRIELQSAPGAGARFTVRLPVGPCPGETDRPPAEEAVSAGTPPGT
jgi:signal transduction histidine kinase